MKKIRFVLLAALLLAFSFMGCKLPETTCTCEFGIVATTDADKVYNRLCDQNVDFNDLEKIALVELDFSSDIKEQALIEIKYSGYIQKAYKEAKRLEMMETRKIPEDINYDDVSNIALEAREKLKKVNPQTIAQASRISGVNPSDISILLVYLESYKRYGK